MSFNTSKLNCTAADCYPFVKFTIMGHSIAVLKPKTSEYFRIEYRLDATSMIIVDPFKLKSTWKVVANCCHFVALANIHPHVLIEVNATGRALNYNPFNTFVNSNVQFIQSSEQNLERVRSIFRQAVKSLSGDDFIRGLIELYMIENGNSPPSIEEVLKYFRFDKDDRLDPRILTQRSARQGES